MESLPAIFLTSFLVALSGALMPGPMLTLTVAEAARTGWASGPAIVLGHGVLELALLLLVVMGLGGFLVSEASVRAMGLIGGTALVLMGATTVYGAAKERPSGPEPAGAASRVKAGGWAAGQVARGAVASVSNPYWVLWWATVGLGYLALAGRMGPAGVGSFFGGHILADLAWYTLVSSLVASGRRMIAGRAYSFVTAGCGVFLAGFGCYFIYRSAGA